MIHLTQRNLPYRVRLITTFVVPWLLTSLFSFFFFPYVQRVEGEANARRQLEILSDMLAFSVGVGLGEGNFALVQKAFDWSRFDQNVAYIGILDERNELLFQNNPGILPPNVRVAHAPQGVTPVGPGLLSVTPVISDGKRMGTVVLLYSFENVEESIHVNQRMSILASFLVMLLGLWGTRLLTRQAKELEAAKVEAERQAMTVRVQAEALASSNTRLEQANAELHTAQKELQIAHDDLEVRVVERTNALEEANTALRLNQGRLSVAMDAARMSPWDMDLTSGDLAIAGEFKDILHDSTAHYRRVLHHIHCDDRGVVVAAFRQAVLNNASLEIEYRILRDDGEVSWIASFGRALEGSDGKSAHIVGINMDINDRKMSEQALRTSLQEKETLLKEVHHRVKNNMQVISSLLSLQSSFVKDEFDVELFRESQLRVKSMAMVHEQLYRSETLSKIEFGEYLRLLASGLLRAYQHTDIALRTEVEDVRFGVDTAIPCGLIVNELVTNAIKHAFPDGRDGEIAVAVARNADKTCCLSVSDNGIGIPADVDFSEGNTLGVNLVHALTEQLEGTILIERTRGTRVTITFPWEEETAAF